jgi:hypothetical protein
MEAILQAIFEVLIVGVFRYPGAFYLWVMSGFKKSYDQWLRQGDGSLAGIVGVVVTVGLVFLVRWLL